MKPLVGGAFCRAFKKLGWRCPIGSGGDGGSNSVAAAITGLTSNAFYSNYAAVGDAAGIGIIVNEGDPDTIAWGSTPGGSEYGTGLSPSSYDAADTGDPDAPARLYYSGTSGEKSFAGSVAIRAALAVNTAPPELTNSDPTGSDLGDTITLDGDTWTAPAAVTYLRQVYVDGDLIDDAGDPVEFDVVLGMSGLEVTGSAAATTSGGTVTVEATGSFIIDVFTAPNITGVPTVSGTAQVGQTLTLTAASRTGNPTPTRTWQKRRDGVANGATFTGSSYLIVAGDEGTELSFDQIETNDLGTDSATSAATAAVAPASSPAVITINSVGPQASDGSVDVNYSIDKDDGAVEVLLFSAGLDDPDDVAQFNTGATSGYIDIGSVALTVAGSEIPLTGPDGLLGSFKIATLPSGGTAADIVVSAAFALDSTDSVLSPAAFFPGASSGQVAYAFTPDEGGTFRVSIFADGASPSDDDKLDGTGAVATATGSGTADVASAGTLSGVASTAYDGYIAYTDDFGNTEIVGPFDVTSAAAGGGSLTLIEIGVTGELGASGSVGMDFTDVLEGDRIVIMASKGRGNTAGGPTAIVVGGFGATPRMTTDDGSLRTKCLGWDMVATAGMEGNASVVIDYTMTATGFGSTFLSVYAIRGSIATVTALESVKGTGPAPANVRGDLAVNSNGVVLLAAINEDAAADMTMTPTAPLATDLYALNSSAQGNLHASGIPASTETLSVGYDQTDGSAANAHYAMGALAYAA